MMKIKKMLKSKTYQKIYISYIYLVLFTILLLSVVLFYLFSKITIKEIVNNSTYDLKQKSYAAQTIEEQVINLSVQLSNEPKIIESLEHNEYSEISEYYVKNLLKDIYAMYPFVESVEMYNLQNDIYYHFIDYTDKGKNHIEQDTKNRIEQAHDQYMFSVSRMLTDPDNTYFEHNKNVVSFFMLGNNIIESSNIIIINVDQKYLQSIIKSIGLDKGEYIIDVDGNVLSHPKEEMIGQNISEFGYIDQILQSSLDMGHFFDYENGEKIVVQYAKVNDLGWCFVTNQRYEGLVTKLSNIKIKIIIIDIILFFLSAAIVYWISGGIYNPLKSLAEGLIKGKKEQVIIENDLDEYQIINEVVSQYREDTIFAQSKVDTALGLVKSYALNILLKGSDITVVERLMEFDYKEDFEFLSEKNNDFCVFVCEINHNNMIEKDYTDKNELLVYYSIINIMKGILDDVFDNEIVSIEDDLIAVLVYGERVSLESYVMLAFHDIQASIQKHFDLKLSVGVGGLCYSLDKISESYNRAVDNLKLCFFYGDSVIIDNEVADDHRAQKRLPNYDIDKNILNHLFVENGDKNKTIDYYLSLFINDLSLSGYEDAKQRIVKQIDSIKRMIYTNFKEEQFDSIIIDEQCKKIVSANNLGNTKQYIEELIGEVRSIVAKLGRDDTLDKHKRLVEEVKQYFNKHYANPNLSASMVAEYVGVSPGYLGKLFKQIENTSLLKCLAYIRLERSKKLLEESDLPVSTIAEEVGIVSAAYFATLFKKNYGCTALQYREMTNPKMKKVVV